MESITIEPFLPHTGDPAILAQLVECYREVFAEPPWNEWLKCRLCPAHWGKPQASELAAMEFRHCDKPVTDYWSHAKVVADLFEDADPSLIIWLAIEKTREDQQVVGFSWGSSIATKWHRFGIDMQESLQRELGTDPEHDPTIVYQTDIGVRATHRRKGLARRLATARNQDFLDRGFRTGVLKVLAEPEPSVTFQWYSRLGYRVAHRFPPENGRVVLVRELEPHLFDRRT